MGIHKLNPIPSLKKTVHCGNDTIKIIDTAKEFSIVKLNKIHSINVQQVRVLDFSLWSILDADFKIIDGGYYL